MIVPIDRPSARVIVVDGTGCVLLFRIEDRQDPKPPLWITPGGGVERGEALAKAAARELAEETGLLIGPAELGNPVAICRGEWTFRGRHLYSVETYFAWRTDRFEPSTAGWEPLEHVLHVGWRWWTTEELDATNEVVLPGRLSDVLRSIALGAIESPIRIALGKR